MNHPTRETMTLLAYGFLNSSEEAAARAHLAECPACRAEWAASRGEVSAVKGAFEPAVANGSRLVAWWPAAAGFAAALLVGLLIPDRSNSKRDPAAQRPVARRAAERGLSTNQDGLVAIGTGSLQGAGAATVLRLVEGRAAIARGGPHGTIVVAAGAQVILRPGAEMVLQSGEGETRMLCREGAAQVIAGGVTAELHPGDAAAVLPGQPPTILSAAEDAAKRLADLRDRVAVLERAVSALPATSDKESPQSVGTWLAKQAAQGRMMGEDAKVGEELGRLWMRLMRESGLSSSDLESGTARERLIAGYLEGRGCPLSPEKRHEWDKELAAHETAWGLYFRGRQALPALERALAAAKVAAGRGPRYAALLDEVQRKAVAELDPAFRDWRTRFLPGFDVVVGIGGPEKALEQVGFMGGGMPDDAKEIERGLLEGCLAIHDAADPADRAAEQVALLELLAKTRDRLVNDAGLAPERANSLLVNFVRGAKK